jgi:hypothetical protein
MNRYEIALGKSKPEVVEEDPWLCKICGQHFSSASYGGPGICPSCDCGRFPEGWTREQFYRAMMKAGQKHVRLR